MRTSRNRKIKGTIKMTVLEQRFMETVPHMLAEIAKQLKKINQLKALELRGKYNLNITPEMIDSIVDD